MAKEKLDFEVKKLLELKSKLGVLRGKNWPRDFAMIDNLCSRVCTHTVIILAKLCCTCHDVVCIVICRHCSSCSRKERKKDKEVTCNSSL